MKKWLFVFCCLFLFFRGFCNPIIYNIPRNVERKVYKWYNSLSYNEHDSIYFRLGIAPHNNQEYVVRCCSYNNDYWSSIAHRSNRLLHIKGLFFPIVFDYDDNYSITREQTFFVPGELGGREGLIKRVITIFHGESFRFRFNKKQSKPIFEEDTLFTTNRTLSFPIIYYINDCVEVELIDYLNSFASQELQSYYGFFVLKEGKKQFVLYQAKEDMMDIIHKSNRFLYLNGFYLPLFFEYDDFFSFSFFKNRKTSTECLMIVLDSMCG